MFILCSWDPYDMTCVATMEETFSEISCMALTCVLFKLIYTAHIFMVVRTYILLNMYKYINIVYNYTYNVN